MKKLSKWLLSSLLALVMIVTMLPTVAFAENWNATDKITIKVRVYDQSTGMSYAVGTDTCTKGDQYIQSDPYQIPPLTKFVDASKFGSVIKVVGNWYFPAHDSSQGATVNWSCNVSSVTMTYWVTSYNPAGNSGGGTTVPGESVPSDAVWKFYLKYDLAGGTNGSSFPTQSYGATSKYEKSHTFETHTVMPVRDGYVFKGWQQSGSISEKRALGDECLVSAKDISGYNGGTVTDTLTAIWEEIESTPATSVTLTYKSNDGDTELAKMSFLAGDSVIVADYSSSWPAKDGYTFKGWATSPNSEEVTYTAGASFIINAGTTLYAVWEEKPKDPEITGEDTVYHITKVFDGVQAPEGFGMTYSYTNLATNEKVTGTVILTEQSDGSWTGTIDGLPYYKNVEEGTTYNLSITEENADVAGYELSINGGTAAKINGKTVVYAVSATTESTLYRTITNTYTKTDEPKVEYTVTYTDGVEGEVIFEDQCYRVEGGNATPEFNGTPAREGYTFVGWNPKVAETVTGDVVYTAQWTIDPTDPTDPSDPANPTDPAPTEKISEPGMDKEVVGDNDVKPGDTVSYTLTSTVPENLKDIIGYEDDSDNNISVFSLGTAGEYVLTFHDKMDEKLTLNEDTINVKINGTEINNKYYTITTTDLGDKCTFEVAVDLAAMYNDDKIAENDLGVAPIVVSYTATLSDEAEPGAYQNNAWVTWGDNGESSYDTEEVYTYGIQIFKFDTTTSSSDKRTPLSGAGFELTDKKEGGEVIATGITGESGYLKFDGLKEGTYYLTETKAPDGYMKNKKAITVTISKDAAGSDYIVDVEFGNTPAPGTGGSGTRLYTIGGIAIICLAGMVLVISRRKKKTM